MRFVHATDLQNHVVKDHSVKDNLENDTNKKVEQGAGYSLGQFDSRCFKCGYILFTKETTEEHGKPKLVCKLCPIIDQRQES